MVTSLQLEVTSDLEEFSGNNPDKPSSETTGDPPAGTIPEVADLPAGNSAGAAQAGMQVGTDLSAPTKMSKATEIYRSMVGKKGTSRKEIVAAFIEEVGLTKAGAATYYQMIKKPRR